MCQSSPTNRLVLQYSDGSPLRCHIKGCMHYISNCRYSDIKSVEYTHIQFGQLFTIGFALTYFDKNREMPDFIDLNQKLTRLSNNIVLLVFRPFIYFEICINIFYCIPSKVGTPCI